MPVDCLRRSAIRYWELLVVVHGLTGMICVRRFLKSLGMQFQWKTSGKKATLVGGWATPLKIWKSVGIIVPNIWKVIIHSTIHVPNHQAAQVQGPISIHIPTYEPCNLMFLFHEYSHVHPQVNTLCSHTNKTPTMWGPPPVMLVCLDSPQ